MTTVDKSTIHNTVISIQLPSQITALLNLHRFDIDEMFRV